MEPTPKAPRLVQRGEAHGKLVHEILLRFGSRSGLRLWKNATGVAERGGRVIRYGLKGSADILGILGPHGRLVAIEAKTGSAVQTAEQKAFEAVILSLGGLYVLARAADDVELALHMAGAGCA